MTLRTKFLALFLCLGALPLLGLGVLGYVESTRALEELLGNRTAAIAGRAAEELTRLYALSVSDLRFLAENAESRRLLMERDPFGEVLTDSERESAESFLDEAWAAVGESWRWVELRGSAGELIYRWGTDEEGSAFELLGGQGVGLPEHVVTRPVVDGVRGSEQEIGSIRGSLALNDVLPRSELGAAFGEEGYSVVLDRGTGEALFHSERGSVRRAPWPLDEQGDWRPGAGQSTTGEGALSYSEDGVDRVASFVSLVDPPWTVLSSASLDEFVAPFARTGSVALLIVVVLTATMSLVFVLLTRRATDSLLRLTEAADEVSRGDLSPALPQPGHDEVGRLSAAFATMVGQIQAMLRRVEESRQMSAVGEFTAQLSHEIRNPLTAIKLNLQRLERGVERSEVPREYAKPVSLCLREVKRLDRTVRGVLRVGRTRPLRHEPVSVHEVLEAALEVLAPQMEDRAVRVETDFSAREDEVLGDREQLEGAFLNLFLNAVEAMSGGGTLRVATDTRGLAAEETPDVAGASRAGPLIRVEVGDDGPGIPEGLEERVFDPFFTSKEGGSGFGLPLALRVMEEHSGTLTLRPYDEGRPGATFDVLLPLTTEGAG
jgi:signal transduction histidine kinase